MNILIVDDEEDLRRLVVMYLNNSGFNTFESDGYTGIVRLLDTEKIDLILLDIMLPDMNGFEICKEIRKNSNVPIIFLSAKGEEWDKVKGLQLGGDDYIVKPFSPGELVARIEAVLRRFHLPIKSDSILEYGPIKLDVDQRRLTVNGVDINVTYKEFELLGLMLKSPSKVFMRETLLDQVWGIDYQGGLRTVDTHIKTLRMKMGDNAGGMIQTVWGCGYKMELPK
ncbi:response regulator transcription factor [Bacillus sp. FJAT-49732]|uniref:Response regulator transcription factor n=1 Tax=Lederbergia citrisecunda TaxID=2833583 RepID=A0A942YIF1_9BACI|nr:response regulator transcription factor [Lederbergia citrisecunda]MBS4198258.1 response regulator transcription factor [Lederbergia citrisecunda]